MNVHDFYDEAVEEIPPEEFLDWRESIDNYYRKGKKGESQSQTVIEFHHQQSIG